MGSLIFTFIAKNAYWLCLFIGMVGLLGYIAGFKKGGRVSVFCVIIYWVVAAVCSAL
ncbi:hypothetical protein [Clostridium magnum]|uniref:Uncharacterized protein n=1 Tax=Clostridium magnum DSM 2767 TaxID=1121326 RepID=A0A162QN46_9CLOT|nr:hypothetical protein [Clostridium magnum]KZL88739.1 hypothetical protein CLMAG_60280 [Clostridium magnum DSM 2767]SHJ61754.1 hypothetical protein SAMN02745944_06242 [Clostridium magnum DSM 2767]